MTLDPTQLEILNRDRFACPPSLDLIEDYINENKMSDAQFERFMGISPKLMWDIRQGRKKLPVKAWGWVYDRVVPPFALTCLRYKLVYRNSDINSDKKTPKRGDNDNNTQILGKLNGLK